MGKSFKDDSDDETEDKLDGDNNINSINQNENNIISTTVPKKEKEIT